MSRTVISDTCSTPSIIESASASRSLCSNAPCRSSSSSSRSSGSRVRNADSRSSSVGLSALSLRSSLIALAAHGRRHARKDPAPRARQGSPTRALPSARRRRCRDRSLADAASRGRRDARNGQRAECAARVPPARTTGAHSTTSPSAPAAAIVTRISTFVACSLAAVRGVEREALVPRRRTHRHLGRRGERGAVQRASVGARRRVAMRGRVRAAATGAARRAARSRLPCCAARPRRRPR